MVDLKTLVKAGEHAYSSMTMMIEKAPCFATWIGGMMKILMKGTDSLVREDQ